MKYANIFKTGLLFTVLTLILMGIGYFVGGSNAVLPFFLISLVMNLMGYWFSSKIALTMARARPLQPAEAPYLESQTRELADRMGIPVPALYVSDDPQPNAFATGRNPKNGVVCVTRGLLNLLTEEEVRGVLAHELGHIKSRDVLLSTLAAVMAGAISYLAHMGFYFGNDDHEGHSSGNFLMVILAPIAALLIQMAISRSREYSADEAAARATKQPMALGNALMKIESYAHQLPVSANPALSSLYIQNPFKGGKMLEWFSTHPPTEKRVARLKSLEV